MVNPHPFSLAIVLVGSELLPDLYVRAAGVPSNVIV